MTKTNFLGIPVEGEIQRNSRTSVEQRPIEDLQPELMKVLADERIEKIRWRQYTPYFNDGDLCEFRIYSLDVKPTEEAGGREDDGDYEDGFIDSWSMKYYAEHTTDPRPELLPLYELTKPLNDMLTSGAFYNVLEGAFGDHAEVTVTSAGITVDSYEHD